MPAVSTRRSSQTGPPGRLLARCASARPLVVRCLAEWSRARWLQAVVGNCLRDNAPAGVRCDNVSDETVVGNVVSNSDGAAGLMLV